MDIIIIILAVVSVVMAIADLVGAAVTLKPWFYPLDSIILIFFAIDYFFRLFTAKDKKDFFKRNIFDLIAIIPFGPLFSFFRVFRIFRLTKLVKLFKIVRFIGISGRFKQRIDAFLHTNGLIYVIYINIACLLVGSIAIYITEKGLTVQSFGDAVWWAFVTTTTVGYGDISPKTGIGRIIAAVLMMCGIGLISMLTGTIATYFTAIANQDAKTKKMDELKTIADILTAEQLDELINFANNISARDKIVQ
ncbi:ion transporter [Mahella australiensis]|uniref:Ion transport 2 domain protein n=1 Tax=Mahella australiensis (strain DSM 15567 / CIP 107919 / 50-1 BON) TaxID=697281 RepID=F3ZXJ8_MAHA5|nr:ion transporter [Mahella australiensis]AEE97679.1 Ion transport 2 domain protein [Mahella australiensis 50-1 BON]